MESIDRMREYAETKCGWGVSPEVARRIKEFTDAIEREVEQYVVAEIDAKPMTDENMAADGWIRLPVDADGMPIHVGDVMEFTYDPPQDQPLFEVSGFGADETLFYAARGEVIPRKVTKASVVRHHHAQTVEDVLREFGDWYAHTKGGCDEDGILAEYAAKLRLAEEDA